jgi:hypothetical protein
VNVPRRARWSAAVLAAAVVLTACGSSGTTATTRPPAAGPRTTYVAVGGSDDIGGGTDDPLLDAWTQQFFRRSLPLDAVFVNAAEPGSTVAEALTDQDPLAHDSGATVVTVWLVSADLLDGTPAPAYAQQLLQLLTALRAGGTTQVLVGNVPPLAQLPGYPACLGGATRVARGFRCPAPLPDAAALQADIAAYNRAIAADAARSGAVLVDLGQAVSASSAGGGTAFLDPSGAELSTAGSALVARSFGAALPATTRHTA